MLRKAGIFAAGAVLGAILASGSLVRANSGHSTTPYAAFAGDWYHHGALLHLDAQGHGYERFRVYQQCTQTIQTACDYWVGNAIYTGGYVAFWLAKLSGNVATGYVTNGAFSWQIGTQMTMTMNPGGRKMEVVFVGRQYPACKLHIPNPSSTCGA
jgi:hypothetical protein